MQAVKFKVLDSNYENKVIDSFSRQPFMAFIGARMVKILPGYCEIVLPYKNEISQQHGYFHGGIIGTIADNCGGYSAYSLMPADCSVLTVEYKLNLIASGLGEQLVGRGQVIKSGRTLTTCRSDVFVLKDGVEKQCATSIVTLMAMRGKSDQ
jgi:uncharacterized protein (TIGR00369 family)